MHSSANYRGGDAAVDMSSEMSLTNARQKMRSWRLIVQSKSSISPAMLRICFTGPELAQFKYKPGQALSLQIPLGNDEFGRRDFTIRSHDPEKPQIAIDFVLHDNTPSSIWINEVRPGDMVEARGPRGRTIINPLADWHLFSGDETCIPAIFHMLETLPPRSPAFVFLEVGGESDELPFESKAVAIQWCHRGGRSPGPSQILPDCVRTFEFPAGSGHAYIIGETSNVRQQRQVLLGRGMTRAQIFAEGYWRPGRVGGNDHIDD